MTEKVEYSKEKLERVVEKSFGFSLLFGSMVYKTPIIFDLPTRQKNMNNNNYGRLSDTKNSNFLNEFRDNSIKKTIESYGIEEDINGFIASLQQLAYQKNKTLDYQAYWEGLRSSVLLIKKCSSLLIYKMGNSDVDDTQEFKDMIRESDKFEGEVLKIEGDMIGVKKIMGQFLLAIYGEDQDIVKHFMPILYEE
jgi:hypothetical protein